MFRNVILTAVMLAAVATAVAAQTQSLGTVTITRAVLAGGTPLAPDTYDIRLTNEFVAPQPGQSPDAERRVEFLKNGAVVARDAAVVYEPDAGEPVGTSSGGQPRVQLLKGGEFVRVSATRDGKRYLIHLPVSK